MLLPHLALMTVLVASTSHWPPAPAPERTGIAEIQIRPDTPPPQTPPGVDPARFAAFQRRGDSLAALVDTIVILQPDSIVLHLGQAISLLDTVRTEARRQSGEVIKGGFIASIQSEDGSIAQSIEAGFTGLQVGTTRLCARVTNSRSRLGPNGVWAPEHEGVGGARAPHAISCIPVRVIP